MSHRHLKPALSKNELLIFPSKLFSIWIKKAILLLNKKGHFAEARNLGDIFYFCLSFIIFSQANSRSCVVFFSLPTLPPSYVKWCYFSSSFSSLRSIMLSTSIFSFISKKIMVFLTFKKFCYKEFQQRSKWRRVNKLLSTQLQ